jgi:hypothetical protein
MNPIGGYVIDKGADLFWKELSVDLSKIRSLARWATAKNNPPKRRRNIAKMKELVDSVNRDFELYAPILYPLTPQKCGFKGSVSNFDELEFWMNTNPKGVFTAEGWFL